MDMVLATGISRRGFRRLCRRFVRTLLGVLVGDRAGGALRERDHQPLLDARHDAELVELQPALGQLVEVDDVPARRVRVGEEQQREQHRNANRLDKEDQQRLELDIEGGLREPEHTVMEEVVVRLVARALVVLHQTTVLDLNQDCD